MYSHEQTASELGMSIPKKTIDSLLVNVPEFKQDGKFNSELYSFVVRQMGYTPTSHYKAIYSDFLAQQFLQGVVSTGFSTQKELELLADLLDQSRDYYYLTIPIDVQKKKVQPSADEVKGYYDKYSSKFLTEEKVIIEYVELKSSDLLKNIEIDSDVIEDSYQDILRRAEADVSYKVSHILLDFQDDDSHLAVMDTIQQKIKNNEDFSLLASRYSDDFLTSSEGGDLGYVRKGELPLELDALLQNLSVGEVSEITKTKAGIHLMKLIEVKSAEVPTREVSEPIIRKQVGLQIARDSIPEKIEELKELAYNATSLKSVSDMMDLDLKISDSFGRDGGKGIIANKKVISAAFSPSVMNDGYASDVIEISDDHAVVLFVREKIPSKIQPLTEVAGQIEEIIKYEMASKKILSYGTELKQRLNNGENIESIAKSENLAWQVEFNSKISLSEEEIDPRKKFVFSMILPEKKSAVNHIIMPNGDYVLLALTKVSYGNYENLRLSEKLKIFKSSAAATANRDYGAYIASLLSEADIASE
jgi:peptidyl-prolyl cis-trans isomerase D